MLPLLRHLSLYLLAMLFVGAGLLHFLRPGIYLRIMPPTLPAPLALVYISGFCEVLGGLGLLWPRSRRWAVWGLLALLVAVFPANIYMALIHEQLGIPGWLAWGRLPLQGVLLWWVWKVRR
ncbi:DoxX family protein [Hymenobacter saemangeumensis]